MPTSQNVRSAEAIRRKLRALTAVFLDPAATEHEKANAKVVEGRLKAQVRQEATPEGLWTGKGATRSFAQKICDRNCHPNVSILEVAQA